MLPLLPMFEYPIIRQMLNTTCTYYISNRKSIYLAMIQTIDCIGNTQSTVDLTYNNDKLFLFIYKIFFEFFILYLMKYFATKNFVKLEHYSVIKFLTKELNVL